jgi:hypothetical protein
VQRLGTTMSTAIAFLVLYVRSHAAELQPYAHSDASGYLAKVDPPHQSRLPTLTMKPPAVLIASETRKVHTIISP